MSHKNNTYFLKQNFTHSNFTYKATVARNALNRVTAEHKGGKNIGKQA